MGHAGEGWGLSIACRVSVSDKVTCRQPLSDKLGEAA